VQGWHISSFHQEVIELLKAADADKQEVDALGEVCLQEAFHRAQTTTLFRV
jgi:hypothetical protein